MSPPGAVNTQAKWCRQVNGLTRRNASAQRAVAIARPDTNRSLRTAPTTAFAASRDQPAAAAITRKETRAARISIGTPASLSASAPALRRGKSQRLVQDADGSIRLRGKNQSGKNPNSRETMTCAPAPTKADPRPVELIKTTNPHDRAHQVTDSQGRLIPAARTRRGQTRVLVPEARPRQYPDYYMSNVHEEHGEKVGASFEDQCDALHEMRLRLEGVAGLGYSSGESAAEIARQHIARLESTHGLQQARNRIRRGTWQ